MRADAILCCAMRIWQNRVYKPVPCKILSRFASESSVWGGRAHSHDFPVAPCGLGPCNAVSVNYFAFDCVGFIEIRLFMVGFLTPCFSFGFGFLLSRRLPAVYLNKYIQPFNKHPPLLLVPKLLCAFRHQNSI